MYVFNIGFEALIFNKNYEAEGLFKARISQVFSSEDIFTDRH